MAFELLQCEELVMAEGGGRGACSILRGLVYTHMWGKSIDKDKRGRACSRARAAAAAGTLSEEKRVRRSCCPRHR